MVMPAAFISSAVARLFSDVYKRQGTGGDVVYEFTVVADDDDSLSIADKEIFQPLYGFARPMNCGNGMKQARKKSGNITVSIMKNVKPFYAVLFVNLWRR